MTPEGIAWLQLTKFAALYIPQCHLIKKLVKIIHPLLVSLNDIQVSPQ